MFWSKDVWSTIGPMTSTLISLGHVTLTLRGIAIVTVDWSGIDLLCFEKIQSDIEIHRLLI